MERPVRTIDYLDLQLPIPAGLKPAFEKYLEEYLDQTDIIVITPKMRDLLLKINSKDLIDFLGYVEPIANHEFEIQRFKHEARRQLEDLLNKSLSSDYRYHYKWCLAALSIFKLGRHRVA